MNEDFREIANAGGQITFTTATTDTGERIYQIGFRARSPKPYVVTAIYALRNGIPIAPSPMLGMGEQSPEPPHPDTFQVLIACDSEGKFGHKCPRCNGYWRSGPSARVCPYCALHGQEHQFLSDAQANYVLHYCEVLMDHLTSETDGDMTIDMDEIAEAAMQGDEYPAFYQSEEAQQHNYACEACNETNDILGRYGYCAKCGTRNDLQHFEQKEIPEIRRLLNDNQKPEDQLRRAVSSFDSFVSQYATQLSSLVPMTTKRRDRLDNKRFHDLQDLSETFSNFFDIHAFKGISRQDRNFAERMFLRRHIYEHNGGEVDQKYLDDSGDTTVKLKQHIQESRQSVHDTLGIIVRMAQNIHRGYHEIFPPLESPIEAYKEKKARMWDHRSRNQ